MNNATNIGMEIPSLQSAEMGHNTSDTQMLGLGLGNAGPNQTLGESSPSDYNVPTESEFYKQKEEAESGKTQATLENELRDASSKFEYYQSIMEAIKYGTLTQKQKNDIEQEFLKENPYPQKGFWETKQEYMFRQQEHKEKLEGWLNDKLNEQNNTIHNIKNHENYDARTDDQKWEEKWNKWIADREDSAVQRSKTDIEKAGLNPAMMMGNVGAAGASLGNSGSKESASDRERRRRKEEAERMRAQKEQERLFSQLQAMLMLGTLNALAPKTGINKIMK